MTLWRDRDEICETVQRRLTGDEEVTLSSPALWVENGLIQHVLLSWHKVVKRVHFDLIRPAGTPRILRDALSLDLKVSTALYRRPPLARARIPRTDPHPSLFHRLKKYP